MILTIKYLIILYLFLFTILVTGQEVKDLPITLSQDEGIWQDDHYGNFNVGIYMPIAIGDNFSNKALSHKAGFEAIFYINLGVSKVLLGLNYNQFYSTVSNTTLVGDYDKSVITSIGPMIGYHIIRTDNWRAIISVGAGSVRYVNSKNAIQFSDTGSTFWINPSVQYHFNKTLGIYFTPSYRRDRLQIDAPEAFESFFGSVNYLSIGLGVSIII